MDASKTIWDEASFAYHVNLQTEVKKKVLIDTEYLSFRWSGGFDFLRAGAISEGNNANFINNIPNNVMMSNNDNYGQEENLNNNGGGFII